MDSGSGAGMREGGGGLSWGACRSVNGVGGLLLDGENYGEGHFFSATDYGDVKFVSERAGADQVDEFVAGGNEFAVEFYGDIPGARGPPLRRECPAKRWLSGHPLRFPGRTALRCRG